MGIKMPGWYDILEFGDITKGEDKEGLEESKKYCTWRIGFLCGGFQISPIRLPSS